MNEARLYEVLESTCGRSAQKCHDLMADVEEDIEDWWTNREAEQYEDDLKKHLCVDSLKSCCPPGHYGKSCKPCPGAQGSVCNGAGKCSGDGHRSGSGKCQCDAGYAGKECAECTTAYFRAGSADSNTIRCESCHSSCASCDGGSMDRKPMESFASPSVANDRRTGNPLTPHAHLIAFVPSSAVLRVAMLHACL